LIVKIPENWLLLGKRLSLLMRISLIYETQAWGRKFTALPGVMRYIFSGEDARTTRVSSFNFVPHKSRNRCIFVILML
jgi:hypothetical protein